MNLQIRPLSTTDLTRGHIQLLSILSVAPELSKEHYDEIITDMLVRGKRGGYYPTGEADRRRKEETSRVSFFPALNQPSPFPSSCSHRLKRNRPDRSYWNSFSREEVHSR